MNVNAILDDCFEDQIRSEFGFLVRSLVPDNEGSASEEDIASATRRFAEGVVLAKQARDIAEKILNSGKLKPC